MLGFKITESRGKIESALWTFLRPRSISRTFVDCAACSWWTSTRIQSSTLFGMSTLYNTIKLTCSNALFNIDLDAVQHSERTLFYSRKSRSTSAEYNFYSLFQIILNWIMHNGIEDLIISLFLKKCIKSSMFSFAKWNTLRDTFRLWKIK